ncbi:MAG: epoxyqueuosine reductase QueH [Desulfobacterales bacterium]|nr:epoxyqueuosine reductase QueH [Desulfobacterales bacterium]
MKILLHICCAPCSIFPIKILRSENFDIMGFFFKSNIHPYTECLQRQKTLEEYSNIINLKVIYQNEYDIGGFIQNVVFRETKRCYFCYNDRLKKTAEIALKGKFDYFSSTLLYSKFQKHDLIKEIGDSIGKKIGIPFYYYDFRDGWKEGIEESKKLGLYRQQYCGCIYSEKERYFNNKE